MDIYLGLGSNLDDRRANLEDAVAALAGAGFDVLDVSPVVESPALLPLDAPPEWNRPFLNAALRCRSSLAPEQALERIKAIEARLGRDLGGRRWAPRPIDIDILLWGRERIRTERLVVPHPALAQRDFVLAPLVALNPRLSVPGTGRTVLDLSRELGHRIPLWMGIVNVTPDSFSDGGETTSWPAVEARVDSMLDAGAQIVDVGAESTRPGAEPLNADEEWARLEPILGALTARLGASVLRPRISVDTYHPEVARRALELGADIINDVGGLTAPEMIELAAGSSAEWIAMHSLSVPADRSVTLPGDADPIDEIRRWLDARIAEWDAAGIALRRVVFDPGIGFGKSPLQSLELLRGISRFHSAGLRCLVGHSRKSFMAGVTGRDAADRDLFTIGASLNLCAQGVDILRVHDVRSHISAYRGWAHLLQP